MPLVGTPRGALSASSGWRAKQFSIISAGLWLCALLLLAAPPQVLAFGKTPVARRVSDLQFEDLGPACVSTSLAGGAIASALFAATSSLTLAGKAAADVFLTPSPSDSTISSDGATDSFSAAPAAGPDAPAPPSAHPVSSSSKLGQGCRANCGRAAGQNKPLIIGTQNLQGKSEEKLQFFVDQDKFDVLAITELHGNLADSRTAADLGDRIIDCAAPNPLLDKASGVSLLLSKRACAAVKDSGHVGSRIAWVRIDALPKPMFFVAVYWPYHTRVKRPHREDTAGELFQLLRSTKRKQNDQVFIIGDFNARVAKNTTRTGPFTPHSTPDAGGILMEEFMQEYHLQASQTYFQPSRAAARNTGNATYCQQKDYVQPKHQRYQSDQPPSVIDYILSPAGQGNGINASVKKVSVDWKFSRHERGFIYDHGTVTMEWAAKLHSPAPSPPQPDPSILRLDGEARSVCESFSASSIGAQPNISAVSLPRLQATRQNVISPDEIRQARNGKLDEERTEIVANGITEREANERFVQGVLVDALTSVAGSVRRRIEAAGMYAGLAVTHGAETANRFAGAIPYQGIIDIVQSWPTPRSPTGACAFIRNQTALAYGDTLDVLEITINGLRTATQHGTGALSSENLTAEERWCRVKNCTEAAISKLPKRRSRRRRNATRTAQQLSIHAEWEVLCREQGARADADYRHMKKELNKRKNAAALEGYRKWCREIAEECTIAANANDSKTLYQNAKLLGSKGKGRSSNLQPSIDAMVYNADGSCTYDKKQTKPLETATQRATCFAHFAEHKFRSIGGTMDDLPPVDGNKTAYDRRDDVPSEDELEICLAAMAEGKAGGHDKATAELYRHLYTCKAELFALVRQVWLEEEVPADMTTGVFVMLFKNKGSSDDCSKYRMICLLPHAYKMLSTLLLHRLRFECEGFLNECQAGFRQHRGCRDQIIILAEMIAHIQELGHARAQVSGQDDGKPLASIAFLDYIAAFDSVDHAFLDESLRHAGASPKSRGILRSIYSKANAVVRAKDNTSTEFSENFPVNRGVVQGDIVSPYCFILALQLIMLRHDDNPSSGVVLFPGTDREVRVASLLYADDWATICNTTEEQSSRVTNIAIGSYAEGCLEAHTVKSEHMGIYLPEKMGDVTNEDIEAANFEHACPHCTRSFSTKHGLSVHVGRWCGEAQREEYVNRFAVEYISDARGPPGNRFYLVHWLGKNESAATVAGCAPGTRWTPTWEPERFLVDAQKRIDTFWNSSTHSLQDTIESDTEHRCPHCCFFAKTGPGLKTHTRRCASVPGSRTGQKSVEDIRHMRRKDAWLRRDTAEMGDATLPNCYIFPYLGVQFCGDGNTKHNLNVRQGKASTCFRNLMNIWTDKGLHVGLKLRLYQSLVLSVYTYGHEAWILDAQTLRQINGFNSRCLAAITDREYREEATDPTYDLCSDLRSRRLMYIGHVLRMDPEHMTRRVIVARGTDHRDGDLFMDCPDHDSIETLTEIAYDRKQWRSMVNQLAGKGTHGTVRANTEAETTALINALPDGSILAFTDGGCDGNGANGNWGKAGWGAWIATKFLSDSDPVPLSDLWGPVITDKKSEFYQKCDLGSNNTGELTGILQALLWARQHGGHEPFALCYDSMYAANITSGLWKPKTNKGIASLCREHFIAESERRTGGVHLIHIKGHSDQLGNEKADERVQWGKENGPYCRFRLDGTSEGNYIDQPRPTTATPSLSHPSPSKQLRATADGSLQSYTSNLGKQQANTYTHERATCTPRGFLSNSPLSPMRLTNCTSTDTGFTSALRDPTATFALSFLRPRALNFDKVCQTVNQSAQTMQNLWTSRKTTTATAATIATLDSMTPDIITLATDRPARVYDPAVTPSVPRGSYGHFLRRNTTRSDDSTLAQPPPHGMRGCPNSRSPSGTELGPRQSKTCGRNNAQTRASLSATDSNSADMADHAPQPQHATRSSRMENQAASAGSAARQRTTTRPTRRDSREHPNAAHLSHLQEATSISHSTSSSGVYFTFGNSDNTR